MERRPLTPPTEADREYERFAIESDALEQGADALRELHRPAGHYLVPPWRSLYGLTGPLGPGQIWSVCAFSGRGKTTFLTSFVDELLLQHETVSYLGLETKPKSLRTYFAAYRKGYPPGEILSGRAMLEWPHWISARAELHAEIYRMAKLPDDSRLIVNGQPRIVAKQLGAAFVEAKTVGAKLLVIDHIGHIQSDRQSAFAVNQAVIETLDDLAKQADFPVLVSSQLNNEVLRGDPMTQLRPPQPHHVYMGGLLRQVCTGMLGLYRVADPQASPDVVKQVRQGEREAMSIALPNIMGIICMKHRNLPHEGHTITLRVDRGRVSEPN